MRKALVWLNVPCVGVNVAMMSYHISQGQTAGALFDLALALITGFTVAANLTYTGDVDFDE